MDGDRISRRRVLAASVGVVGALGGCMSPASEPTDSGSATTGAATATDGESASGAATPTGTDSALTLRGERVAGGFTSPVGVEVPRAGEYFVVDQAGRIERRADGAAETVLDLTDRMVEVGGYSERGLLGLAFHPDYPDDSRCFVRYSAPSRAEAPAGYSHTFVLASFAVDTASGQIDPDSETTLLEIAQPQSNHNAGAVTFGPDGYLYVAVGDGGGAGDRGTGHVEDWYDPVAGGNGQDVTENLLGSVLRIDVDATDGERAYGVPSANPLVGQQGRDEQFAWGFRNPWRMSFGPDGRLFAADVGQSRYEEVNVVRRGGNYGWNVREGPACYSQSECPTETPDGDPLIPPVVAYPHSGSDVSGIAVVGGYLYDGERIPALRGQYVFADWRARGRLFVAPETAEGQWPTHAVPVDGIGPNVLSFGRTPAGELLVCTSERGGVSGETGAVFRLRRA